VPAAAVIHRLQALSGFTGRKASLGGFVSLLLKPLAQPGRNNEYGKTKRKKEVGGTHGVGVKSVDIVWNTESEGSQLGLS